MKYQNTKTGFIFESDSICTGEDWREISTSPALVKAKEPEKPIEKPQPKTRSKRTKK